MTAPSTTVPFRMLLDAGLPVENVIDQVERHLSNVQALPAETEDRDAAIAEIEAFLVELRQQK